MEFVQTQSCLFVGSGLQPFGPIDRLHPHPSICTRGIHAAFCALFPPSEFCNCPRPPSNCPRPCRIFEGSVPPPPPPLPPESPVPPTASVPKPPLVPSTSTVVVQVALPPAPVTVAVYVVVCAILTDCREPFGAMEPIPLLMVADVAPVEIIESVKPRPGTTTAGFATSVQVGAVCAFRESGAMSASAPTSSPAENAKGAYVTSI